MSLLTGYLVIRSQQENHARAVLGDAVRLAEAALANDDLEAALAPLSVVAHALDVLGREDEGSLLLQQRFKEVQAANSLCPKTIHEMIEEARRVNGLDSHSNWEDVLRMAYRDHWIVVDTHLSPAGDPTQIRVEFPLLVDGVNVDLVLNTNALRSLKPAGDPQRVIFAAQIENCQRHDSEDGWIVTLDGDTAFLWADARDLRILGFETDEQTLRVLEAQARLLGIHK